MKTLNNYINEALIKKDTKISIYNYHPKDQYELRDLLEQLLKERGKDADLNDIDVSGIQDFCYVSSTRDCGLFYKLDIGNIDISKWDMSNATNISYMFYECKNFNCDLSHWDVGKVKNMNFIFYYCKNFNSDLSHWDVSKVEDMECMFLGCEKFNVDLSSWDPKSATGMRGMFYGCKALKNKPKWYKG